MHATPSKLVTRRRKAEGNEVNKEERVRKLVSPCIQVDELKVVLLAHLPQ